MCNKNTSLKSKLKRVIILITIFIHAQHAEDLMPCCFVIVFVDMPRFLVINEEGILSTKARKKENAFKNKQTNKQHPAAGGTILKSDNIFWGISAEEHMNAVLNFPFFLSYTKY